MSDPSVDPPAAPPFCCRIRATPVSSASCPPSVSSIFSPRASTTRITSIVSRLCSSTSRAFVGTKLTTGMAALFPHVCPGAATHEPERGCTLLGHDFQSIASKNKFCGLLTYTNVREPLGTVRNSSFWRDCFGAQEWPRSSQDEQQTLRRAG